MGLNNEDRNEIVKYRIEKSRMTFQEASVNAELKFWNTAINRLYYSAYYATSALLISNGILAQSHSGVIQMFGLHFIKTNRINRETGKILSILFNARQTGDYEDNYNVTPDDVLPLIEPTKEYIEKVVGMIEGI